MQTAQDKIDLWAYENYVTDVAVRAARASLPGGMTLDIKNGDLVVLADDGEVISLDEICPDLLDLLEPRTARAALLNVITHKPLPKFHPLPVADVPIAPESAKDAVARIMRSRKAFTEGIQWEI